jgi:hypothetical protein
LPVFVFLDFDSMRKYVREGGGHALGCSMAYLECNTDVRERSAAKPRRGKIRKSEELFCFCE